MLRKPILRGVLTAILGLFALLNLQQGLGTLLRGEDWSGSYVTAEATVVDSKETEWPGSTTDSRNLLLFSCMPVVELSVEGVMHRANAEWLQQRYNRGRGPDCMDQAYGERVPVLLAGDATNPILMDPENPPTGAETSIVNLAIASLLIFFLWRLWRPLQASPEPEN